ncbi:hypothetical protein [Alcanivorax quisquiliarum]|uniref:Multidrug transporter n=1 Tax=Alcanivorax quisquiliarum TaxID=2933565 RepID=A0ABT0E3Q2_9GAMM|nr:hypothetical protein [Alcanivorax quisquiliarum]MCK0536447.1 hypothetical protein [Alcanivorax quisquiliarum]
MSFTGVPIVLIGLSLLLVGLGAWLLLRQQWLLQWLKGSAGLLLVALAVCSALYAMNLYSYRELKPDAPVATISFRQLAPQSFVATVALPDGESHDYALSGDLWQLDVRVVHWKGLFALLGARPGYQLERIQGRYLALEHQRSRERASHAIHRPSLGFDLRGEQHRLLLDTALLSAAYLPMADGAIFQVVPVAGQLEGRPLNGVAESAMLE